MLAVRVKMKYAGGSRSGIFTIGLALMNICRSQLLLGRAGHQI